MLIELKKISKDYQVGLEPVHALRTIDCNIDKAEYVAIMDSDVVFKAPVYFKDFFQGTKMTWSYLARTKQNELEEVWGVWKDSVHRMIDKNMDTYYMYNAFPFVFKTASLKGAYDFFIKLRLSASNTQ